MRVDYWLDPEDPKDVQWGGNRIMQKLEGTLFDPGFVV